jgi:hypothetical protein
VQVAAAVEFVVEIDACFCEGDFCEELGGE